MSDYQIERDHVIPAMRAHKGRKEKYPWSGLEVGDSFFVDGGDARSMTSTASHAGRRNGKKFIARAELGGVRVWRYE
jgi:hypothetical protein